jgi:hypothetical protein
MSLVDIGLIVFIALVFLVGIFGVIKVAIFDEKRPKD